MRLAAAAWIAYGEGRKDEAVLLARAGADLEDKTGKHPVTPGSVLPARELLADLLLAEGRPADALREYEASLREAPARFNSLVGAARAAEQAKEMETRPRVLAAAARPDRRRLEASRDRGGQAGPSPDGSRVGPARTAARRASC